MLIKYYRKSSLLFLCALLTCSIGTTTSYAVASHFAYMKNILRKSYHYPKGYFYNKFMAPANRSATFTTSSSNGTNTTLDAKKINFHIAPQLTPSFVGRQKEIASFNPYFAKKDKLVICPPILGLDGVGKTQLALQLIEQHGAEYDYIVWVNAATAQDIEASYRQIAKRLGIKIAPNKTLKEVVHLVEEALKGKRVLYLFDNAPNLKTIQPYCTHGHILITSNKSTPTDWRSKRYSLPLTLAPFSEEEALDFAKEMGADPKDASLKALIGLLPNYPLVLKQLMSGQSAWRNDSFAYLLDNIKQNSALTAQLAENLQAYTTYQNALSYIIQSKLEALRSGENGTALLRLVQQLTCLEAQPIPQSVVLLALGKEKNAAETRDILLTLARNRLITWDGDWDIEGNYMHGGNIYMHSAIQATIGNLYPLTAEQLENFVDGYVAYTIEKVAGASYSTKNYYHQMIPHGEKLLKCVQEKRGEDGYTAKCYLQLSYLYYTQGIYHEKSLKLAKKALDLLLQVHGAQPDADTANAYNILGTLFYSQGAYGQALDYNQKYLDMYKALHGDPPHPAIAIAYKKLGNVYHNQAHYDQALECHQQALEIYKEVHGNSPHADIAGAYSHLGAVYCEQGKYAKARLLYQKALKMYTAIYGDSLHLDIATVYHNLGNVEHNQGLEANARALYQKALDMKLAIYEDTPHPDIATAYNNLGLVYYNQGLPGKALTFFQKALEMYKTVYGNHPHPNVAAAYDNLGNIYDHQGKYSQAIEFHQQSLNMYQNVYRDIRRHPNIATAYNNLGCAYDHQGKYAEPLECYQKSLNIYKEVYGDSPHARIASVYNNLGTVYRNQRQYAQAIECYEKSIDIYKAVYGDIPHADIANAYNNLGSCYYDQGQYSQSLACYQISFKMYKDVYQDSPHPHPNIVTAYRNLGFVYEAKGDMQMANNLYAHAAAVQEKYEEVTKGM